MVATELFALTRKEQRELLGKNKRKAVAKFYCNGCKTTIPRSQGRNLKYRSKGFHNTFHCILCCDEMERIFSTKTGKRHVCSTRVDFKIELKKNK